MLVQGDQLAQSRRRQPFQQDRVGRAIAFEGAVRHEPARRALGLDLRGRLAEGQRLRLGEHVGQQQIVMPAQRIQRLGEGDEIARNQLRSLMDQLIEGMLAVGARFAPVDRPGLVVDLGPIRVTCLPLLSIVNCCK